MPSDRAKQLIEALHEPHSLDKRWDIADAFLAQEREETVLRLSEWPRVPRQPPRLSDPSSAWHDFYRPKRDNLAARIEQTHGQNGEDDGPQGV